VGDLSSHLGRASATGIPDEDGPRPSRVEYMGRKAVLLANDEGPAVVETVGGMMPEFGLRRGRGVLNAHWASGLPRTTPARRSRPTGTAPTWIGEAPVPSSRGDFPLQARASAQAAYRRRDRATRRTAGPPTRSGRWRGSVSRKAPAQPGRASRCAAPRRPCRLPGPAATFVLPGQPAYFTVMRNRQRQRGVAADLNVARHKHSRRSLPARPAAASSCARNVSCLAAPSGTRVRRHRHLVQGRRVLQPRHQRRSAPAGPSISASCPGMVGLDGLRHRSRTSAPGARLGAAW